MSKRELDERQIRRIRKLLKMLSKTVMYALLCIFGYLAWKGSPVAQTLGMWVFIFGFIAIAVHADRCFSGR